MTIGIEIILAPLISLFTVQSIKLATDGIKGNFNLKNILTSYGGMPSSHSAVVTSLTAAVGFRSGVDSAVFGVALIFALIVITDALVLRRFIDQQGDAIRVLMRHLKDIPESDTLLRKKMVRHTLPQVGVGILLGFAIAALLQLVV